VEEISETELDLMAAERAVDEAKDKLVAELEAVSENAGEALARVVHKARPVALAAAAVAGVAVLVGAVALVRSAFSRRRTPRFLSPPSQPSALSQIARQALTAAAGTLAATLARRAVSSLEQEPDAAPKAAPRTNGRGSRVKRASSEETKQSAR